MEVCHDSSYETVCDDGWDELDARVACNQLGFADQGKNNNFSKIVLSLPFPSLLLEATPTGSAHFGQGEGEIYEKVFLCEGSESRLLDCRSEESLPSHCGHEDDAGVRCQSTYAIVPLHKYIASNCISNTVRVSRFLCRGKRSAACR